MKSECQHKWEKRRVCPDDCNIPLAGGVEDLTGGVEDLPHYYIECAFFGSKKL